MPFIPVILKTILMTLGGRLLKIASKWILKILTGKAFEKILLQLVKIAAKRSDTKIDDAIVEALEEKVKPEEEENKDA